MNENTLEFTPGGIAQAGAGYSVNLEELTPADPRLFARPASATEQPVTRARPATASPASEPLDVLKAARARLRFVRSEVKKLRKLEREEAQLERLLSAASRPLASVRGIKTSAG